MMGTVYMNIMQYFLNKSACGPLLNLNILSLIIPNRADETFVLADFGWISCLHPLEVES